MSIKGKAEQASELRGVLSIPEAIRGKSAYELAVMCGFEGTLEEWLDSLKMKYGDLTDEEIAALVADVTDNLSAIVVQIKEELVASVEQNAKVAANAKQDAEAAENEASRYAEAAYGEAERAKTYTDETEQKRTEVIFYAQGAYNDSTAAAESAKQAEAAEAEAKNHRDTALLHKNAANLSETNAKASEDNAKTSENNAAKSATKAENSAKNMEAHEQNSSASATEAKNAETEAKKAAEDAESAKNEAVSNANIATNKANEAAVSSNNASASEKTATDKAKEAGESANAATEAKEAAEKAKEAAEKARDDAENAKGFAEDAATKAEDAADRAENATEFLKNGALFANAIRGRLSGASVRADDVSPIEHELDIKLTGENVEGTKVIRLGKNFANLAGLPETKKYKAVTDTSSGYRIDDDGNIIITSCSTDITSLPYVGTNIKLSELCPEARVGMTMRLSVIDSYSEGASRGNVCIYLDQAATVWAFTEAAKAITITQNMLDSNVVFYASYTLNAVRTISNFQIELGENATEYEPYIAPSEAVTDEDGNVSGLMSLAPSMTLVTDNESAVIECAYNRDTNKVVTELETKLNTLIATIGG